MSDSPSCHCHHCLHLIGQNVPVVFVQRRVGKLLGPFHPFCADVVLREWRLRLDQEATAADPFGIQIVTFDQKELPW